MRPRLVGINHVTLEVSDIDAALAFWGAVFSFELRGRSEGAAFIDMGDQFIALVQAGAPHRNEHRDEHRHFGLVVDDRARVRDLAHAAGAEMIEGASWISAIPGATSSRWSSTVTCSSRSRTPC